MTQESVNIWMEKTLKRAWSRLRNIGAEPLDDSFGWGAMFSMQVDQARTMSGRGLLLTGPDGCGKHTAAFHMVGLLTDRGYECVFLDGYELCAEGFDCASNRINALLDRSYDNKTGLCIMLENLEQCTCRRELLPLLGDLLYDYGLNTDEVPPLFLILLDSDEKTIPAALRSRLRLCRMALPNQKRRKIFLDNKAQGISRYVSLDKFAEVTEGVTYAQLLDLVWNVQDLLDSKDTCLSEADFLDFIRDQMPTPELQSVLMQGAYAAKHYFEQMPQKMYDALTSIQLTAPAAAPVQQAVAEMVVHVNDDMPIDMGERRKEFESMPFKQLEKEVFGGLLNG